MRVFNWRDMFLFASMPEHALHEKATSELARLAIWTDDRILRGELDADEYAPGGSGLPDAEDAATACTLFGGKWDGIE